ncbi:hypothetical protein [Singulisphaera acidiphila]|uniref:Transposase n=1 Tax=Singulisphaera acidiphila (strain ATCC BAA-1392 / DSM 18658 / VKM B-2454 / MOB10) TaxID=886293 RepID=L0DJ73_SINAD|nr:hypothetical protein [Singulisphaera acidiphila]AGA28731.1 hypothetical protein Sinac_4550 [Singulisphaera acidiphila DSM 18658]
MTSLTDRTRARLSVKQLRLRLRTNRRRQARKARATRRRLERIHEQLPKQVRTVLDSLEPAFSRAAHRRLWLEWVLAIPGDRVVFQKLTPGFRQLLLNGLAPAA